jgi:hypothetical protein
LIVENSLFEVNKKVGKIPVPPKKAGKTSPEPPLLSCFRESGPADSHK